MDTASTTAQKSVRLLDDSGRGAAVVMLRGDGTVSKVAPLLAQGFRVLSFAAAGASPDELAAALASLGVTEAAVVANTATAIAALELAAAHPAVVTALALLAPPALGGKAAGLSGLNTPVMALFGTRDAARPPDAARTLCRALPNCRLVYVFDAERALDDDRPEAVAAAVQEFAAKREKFLVTGKSGKLFP